MRDLKINFPDTFLSVVLVGLSFFAVFVLGLLQAAQLIWGNKNAKKTASDLP